MTATDMSILNQSSCKHFVDQECTLIQSISHMPFSPTPEICRACARDNPPQSFNTITKTIANKLLIDSGEIALQKRHGKPGTQLKMMLGWFVTRPPNCDCEDRAMLMDIWGVQGCRRHKKEILGWLRESALDKGLPVSEYFIGTLIDLTLWSCDRESLNSDAS